MQKMTASSFLAKLGETQNRTTKRAEGPRHDALIRDAWARFTRDTKNEQARIRTTKLQAYFEKRLGRIAEDLRLGRRAKMLMPRTGRMMVRNRQPYTALHNLRRRINAENLDDAQVLGELESILLQEEYRYAREIGRPRILYSMETD
ncbi:MAG: hypothetical protein OXI27_09320 [Thaumarchaeota archaeon]|nr:hypothetical protein [Nitrososphaerota archaeon]